MTHPSPLHQALLELSTLAARCAFELDEPVRRAGDLLRECYAAGGKVLACGNGGSAADAQHFVAELVVKMGRERASLPAISLSSDPSIVTACANDFGYERVFARQIEGLGRPGDVLVALSTSGRSPNVLRAIEVAHRQGLRVVVLTGAGGDALLEQCEVVLRVPSANTQLIQEIHMPLLHALVAAVE